MVDDNIMGFPGGSNGKESACNTGDRGSIPGSGRAAGGGIGNPLQYSCLQNSMDREAWWATFLGLQRVGHDWATNFHFSFHNVYLSFSSRRIKFNLLFKIPAFHFLKKFSLVFGLEKFTAMYSEPRWLRIQISGLLKYQVLIPNGVELNT